jgi:hypothetical protein
MPGCSSGKTWLGCRVWYVRPMLVLFSAVLILVSGEVWSELGGGRGGLGGRSRRSSQDCIRYITPITCVICLLNWR